MLGRNNFLAAYVANLVTGFVGNVEHIGDLGPALAVGLCDVRRLDDVLRVLGLDDLHALGPDRCSKLLVDFACVFLRQALCW